MIKFINDLDECRIYWEKLITPSATNIFDLWKVRMCFHEAFKNPPLFIASYKQQNIQGLLPLSEIWESGKYVYFPGEVWENKTWLECNKFFALNAECLYEMLEAAPLPCEIRYLEETHLPTSFKTYEHDETGYLFHPMDFNYSLDNYFQIFPRKTIKKITREVDKLKNMGVSFRLNNLKDFIYLADMNICAFGEESYFTDKRFMQAFEDMVSWLFEHDYLKITTVTIGGEIAAIDLGALWNNKYTLMAGGVSPEFPGVAKLINLHHLERACREKYDSVDFLCGDFNWKSRFRLKPRPLFKINTGVASLPTKEKMFVYV